MSLYLVSIQPNPPGRDTLRPGHATNAALNEEWVEFRAEGARSLIGDEVSHFTFDNACRKTGEDTLIRFGSVSLAQGQHLRLHTGSGTNQLLGGTYHFYLGRSWYVWNNACGDRATLRYSGNVVDSAYYRAFPPEGTLVRVIGTDRFEPAPTYSYYSR